MELHPTAVVAGGDALARDDDGRVVFVEGALPGESVLVELTEERRDFAKARVVEVVDPSPDRIAAPCPHVGEGCGGCGWQHVSAEAQRRLKETIVADALRRTGGLANVPPIATVALPPFAYRTTVRVAVDQGAARFHVRRGNELVDASGCLVAHPRLIPLLDASFGDAHTAVLRVSADTGERLAWCRPVTSGVALPDDVFVVDDRSVDGAFIHERVLSRRFRVSARSFFQASPEAAAAIAREVVVRCDDGVRDIADLYAGVGLLGAAAADATGARIELVEQSWSAVADARLNVADLDARVMAGEVVDWQPDRRFDAVIADPGRPGLSRPGVAAVVRSKPAAVVLVACDAASFARDTALLHAAGFTLGAITLVDAFPQTPHIEAIVRFDCHTRW